MRAALTATTTAVLTVSAWLSWLGFHAPRFDDPVTGQSSGPYETWQGVGLGLTFLVIVVAAAWFGSPYAAAAGPPTGLVLIASVDWGTAPDADGLWIIGVTMLGFCAAAGAVVVVVATTLARRYLLETSERRAPARGGPAG
ncbi:hypothetical protein [Nocardioides dongkuii]|uniref:hypothetical protein n=1 Tax=Nocardioides dongkuii TaxID=2760089 RepID=UPI0015F7910D|nr:hypothetical protein [Nocardioides dongkuii]